MTMPCPSQRNAVLSSQHLHQCRWQVRPYDGGPYMHTFRTCSYCGSIHPDELIEHVRLGTGQLHGTTQNNKVYLDIPNPVAGQRVRVGGECGPVFSPDAPSGVIARLLAEHSMPDRLGRPTLRERIRGRYSRAIMGEAPTLVRAKLRTWHLSEDQRLELQALVRGEPTT